MVAVTMFVIVHVVLSTEQQLCVTVVFVLPRHRNFCTTMVPILPTPPLTRRDPLRLIPWTHEVMKTIVYTFYAFCCTNLCHSTGRSSGRAAKPAWPRARLTGRPGGAGGPGASVASICTMTTDKDKVGRGNSGHGIVRGNSGHFNVATGKKHPFILASSEL